MHIPKKFAVSSDQVSQFVQDYGFAALVTQAEENWFTTLIPMLLEAESPAVFIGHMARANPHWKHLEANESLVLFLGPHAYISPAWYSDTQEVPTWNYGMVRATVTASLIEDTGELDKLVRDTVDKYEGMAGNPWDQEIDPDYWDRQLRHIVGFRLVVGDITGKFKLGQNRSKKDQQSLARALESNPSTRELWSFMQGRVDRD